MKALVTGARAPASMDVIRSLVLQGFDVYSADSLSFPLGRFVQGIKKHITLPKPNKNVAAFIAALKTVVLEYKIDLVIPTCEEILFVSQGFQELSQCTRLLSEPFERLKQLHNKHQFNQLVLQYGLHAPASVLLNGNEDKANIPQHQEMILKPVYSRFGSHLMVKPGAQQLADLQINVPYLAQEFISGKEYCAYAIADKGRVLVHATYHPKYTTGPAAGIYFEQVDIPAINEFVTVFCREYQFNGQIAFDFIVRDENAYVLECNPRITSGFHFIADQINWQGLLAGEVQHTSLSSTPYMLGLAMKLHGLNYFKQQPRAFINDYKRAHDVLKNKAYPRLGLKSLLTLSNILVRMIKESKNFHPASTDDIEYNGE